MKSVKERTIESPCVISETVEDTGGGMSILYFEIEALEDGERSTFFVCEDPNDEDGVIWRRITVLDCCGCDDPLRGWLKVPENALSHCPGMKEILEDLHDETAEVMRTYGLKGHERKYPERKLPYSENARYQLRPGEYYGSLFRYVERGKVRLYGFRDFRGRKGIEYDRPKFITEYRLGNEQAAEDVRLNIEGTTNLLMKGQA